MSLADQLQKHDGRDYFNAKIAQDAGGFDSLTSGYNVMRKTPRWYRWFKNFLRRLVKSGAGPVVHDVLLDLCEELPFTVAPKGDELSNVEPVGASVETVERFASFATAMMRAFADGRLSETEESGLVDMLNQIDRASAEIRESLKRLRPRVRAAG